MRDTLRFILNGKLEVIDDCLPTDTVLDYLRERKKLSGSKEGCAEGDCGACTVVLVETRQGKLVYRAVNSCILFMPVLDGKQLITVEDLQCEGALHPVQQAMVDQHGSQCGFCTPGFVMSMLAMFHHAQSDRDSRACIDATLAGNLCRCTGYEPIVQAVRQALDGERKDQYSRAEPETVKLLNALQSNEMLALSHDGRKFFAPLTLAQLCSILNEHPDSTIVAGATDVGLWVTKQLREFQTVVYTGQVVELCEIRKDQETEEISIGAAVTYTDAMTTLIEAYPDMQEILTRLGALQVRNAGTIGGNIANGSPIGDMPPVLIALNARLELSSAEGNRMIPLQDFFIDYGKQDLKAGECVSRVILPLPEAHQHFRAYKISKRVEQDISAVCAAFSLKLEGSTVSEIRIAFGGMAATPKRASACETALLGQPWNMETIERAMQAMNTDFSPISDMRASAGYRMTVARNLLKRFYLELSDADTDVRLARHTGTYESLSRP